MEVCTLNKYLVIVINLFDEGKFVELAGKTNKFFNVHFFKEIIKETSA